MAIDFTVLGTVPALAQPSSSTCWATTATMLHSWKNLSVGIPTALGTIGTQYVAKFNQNQGLSGAEKPGFLGAMGSTAEPPRNHAVNGWLQLLQAHGPLWATTNEGTTQDFAVHARLMTAIKGDGTFDRASATLLDPDGGIRSVETLAAFAKKFEQIAIGDLGAGADLRPQVVRW